MTRTFETGTPRLLAELGGAVGWVTFNDPARHNAMNAAMWEAVPVAVKALAAAPECRVIVLRGAGERAFVSGADISEFDEHRNNPASAAAYEVAIEKALDSLRGAGRPVIAMIRGYCIGGGMSLALAADLRIASEDAEFAIPAARLGLAYPRHAIGDLVAVAGVPLARELLYTACRLDAGEAKAARLVNRVVAADRLEAETLALADTIAANAPLTIAAAKRSIAFVAQGFGDAAEVDRLAALCFDSADYAEGRAAFAGKRKPQFTGR